MKDFSYTRHRAQAERKRQKKKKSYRKSSLATSSRINRASFFFWEAVSFKSFACIMQILRVKRRPESNLQNKKTNPKKKKQFILLNVKNACLLAYLHKKKQFILLNVKNACLLAYLHKKKQFILLNVKNACLLTKPCKQL